MSSLLLTLKNIGPNPVMPNSFGTGPFSHGVPEAIPSTNSSEKSTYSASSKSLNSNVFLPNISLTS
jgi:hypothetical protein